MEKLEKVFGKHSVRALFLARPGDVRRFVVAGKDEYHAEMIAQARQHGLKVEHLEWPAFKKLGEFTEDDKHQGVMAYAKPRRAYGDRDIGLLDEDGCVLVCDQISNPQNLATIVRGAAFFKANAVIVMKNRSADMSPTVVRYAVGGAEFVKVFTVTNLAAALEQLKAINYWVYGLDERGEATLAQSDFGPRAAFVIGAEGQGLRPKTRKFCDALVRIPGGLEGVESINAGVAATVALAEFTRLMD